MPVHRSAVLVAPSVRERLAAVTDGNVPTGRGNKYAGQWPMFTVVGVILAVIVASAARPSAVIVVCAAEFGVVWLIFLAGFCYRERLQQLDKRPRFRYLGRMVE